jgi:ABC-type multidrug transport system ATPase subunit
VAAIVQFEGAGVSLGGRPILRDLDLVVGPGEAVGIAGPNGSGKTTLVRTAATLVSIDRGKAAVLGADAIRPDLETRRSIGLIGHQPSLIPQLTLLENLQHIARLAGVDEARIPRALEVVGLADAAGRRAEACSFGMRRRIEIAHLLLTRPRLLLLDEAASGLDEAARALISALVESVLERGGGCIVVSHDRAHLLELCSMVRTLSNGRLEDPS